MNRSQYLVVFITTNSTEEAERIGDRLVNEGLAACVNILEGITSIYKWQGKVVKDDEVLMIVKTSRSHFQDLRKRVSQMHSYDVPEIIGVDLASISEDYRKFLEGVLGT